MAARGSSRSRRYLAVIGDMVGSRSLPQAERARVQKVFSRQIAAINASGRYRPTIRSQFVITIGDEFQAILAKGEMVPDLIWTLSAFPGLPAIRLGFGYGALDTAIPEYAINLDGPALHRARAAVDRAKAKDLLGGVFMGFGEQVDLAANGIARLLWFHRQRRTPSQLEILNRLRSGQSQAEISRSTGLSRQAVSDHARAAGWEAWSAGEAALRAILEVGVGSALPNDPQRLRSHASRPDLA